MQDPKLTRPKIGDRVRLDPTPTEHQNGLNGLPQHTYYGVITYINCHCRWYRVEYTNAKGLTMYACFPIWAKSDPDGSRNYPAILGAKKRRTHAPWHKNKID